MPRLAPDLADDLIATARDAADAAALETLRHFRSPGLPTDNKSASDFDPVTVADRAAEKAIRDVLAARRPDDAILGEEYGAAKGQTGLTWVLDPIDGTRGYVSGTPTWGTLIAVSDAEGPVIGLIDQPYIGERFIGGPGGAHIEYRADRKSIQTRTGVALAEATLFTTFPEIGSPDERTAFLRVEEMVKLTRYGCDCYAYALLAAGQIDLVIEAGLHAYDIQAPIALIEAAGGIVTDWSGGPVWQGGRAIAAASADLHRDALALLNAT